MVATTDIHAADVPKAAQLKHGALSLPETIGQSIANIAPTLTPALNISVVAGLAGVQSWLAYLIATLACVFVGGSISTLAKRHPEAGSYFVYIGRNFGPVAGALGGWAMILAYLTTAAAVVFGFPLFLGNFLHVFNISLSNAELVVFMVAFLGLVTFAAFRDIQVSSRIGLVLETISIGIIIIITAIVVGHHGSVVDSKELDLSKMNFGGVKTAMAFAVFSFVGFESAATLAKESANPHRNVPFAVIGSAALAGLFFTVMAYFMVLGMDDNCRRHRRVFLALRRHDQCGASALGRRRGVFRRHDQRLRLRPGLHQCQLAHAVFHGPLPVPARLHGSGAQEA